MSKPEQTWSCARTARREGFDLSRVDDGTVRIGCSQCDALVINGTPCHERGCPNAARPR